MSRLSNYFFFSKLVLFPLLLLAVTLALITLSFIHEIKSADISAVEFATIEARASYARDFAYRTWASMHGGVYVEINDRVKPNPYLEVPNREIYADGKVYTLINPAYMNRQVYELDTINLLKTKITSLKPLNPNNTPDEWEEKALKIFEDGVDEVVSVETIEDEDYLRLIKPFYVEESCLKCHGKQGYKIGQVRGGISISIPMSYYYDIAKTHSNGTLISHSAAFIFILLLYFWWYAIYRKQSLREATLKEKLVLQKNDLIEVNSELVRSKLKVEENEAFLKAALENSQAGIVIADMPDGEILFANKAGLLINDDKEYDDIEKYSDINKIVSSWQILHFDGTPYKSNEVPLTRAVLYGETNSKEFIIRRENYEDKFVWANVAPIIDKNGIQIAAINVFLDITELKKAQDHLKEKNQQLSELNKEYLHAKQLAEESERLKAAFLANISHEIRTPMNGIMGFLQLLKTTKSSDKFYTKYMDIITLSGDRLLTTINDIIQISRIESGQVSVVKEVVDISEFLKYLLDFFEPQAQKKGTNLTLISDFGKDENIITDVSKLDSILTNLINNAIKFTENGSISCTCSSEDNFIKFIISDTGVGINKERLHSIFDRFVQADLSLSRGYEGSGLGLSIVKAYVEMLKGEIWVESEEGVGSTFFLKIPYEKSQKDTPTDINHKEENTIGSSLKILVAEDDEVSIELIKSFFDKDNHRITFAHTGREVLDKFIHDNDFDLILMDLKMPVMDGITAIREIRKIDKTIPIIAQTAFAFPSDKTEAKEAGCNDYISKPILKEELLNKINAVLGI